MSAENLAEVIESLKKDVEKLAKTNESLQRQVDRTTAVTECLRLMGRYAYLHATNRHAEMVELFAKKAPDVRVQLGHAGIWDGTEGIKKVYQGMGGMTFDPESSKGVMIIHPNITPYVEVAGDGKTAKGVWLSNGLTTLRNRETGKLDPCWAWGTYGIDFIKEDGQWKFWHIHVYRLFHAPYHESWAEHDTASERADAPSNADRPPIDDYPYDANKVFVFKPDLPEPYETFDEKTAY